MKRRCEHALDELVGLASGDTPNEQPATVEARRLPDGEDATT